MAAEDAEELQTAREDRETADGAEILAEHACLFLVLHAERPLSGGARFSLAALDEVHVGRGSGARIRADRTGRRLELRLPSPLLSSTHARLVRDGDHWRVEDGGSTNGVYVNGAKCTTRALGPSDVLEFGRIFFTIRTSTCSVGQSILDRVSSDETDGGVLGFDTLLPRIDARAGELRRVAASRVCIALSGETGTGKEVLARAIHTISRRSGPFVAVNCGALTTTLLEGQLFGHLRGAFSGAIADAAGFIRSAHTGTLLLDEAGDLSASAQAALLRVVQEGEVVPVGASRPQRVDVRFIAASAVPLERSVADGTFRADLFARLSGFSYRLVPLRQRREDAGIIIASILRRLGISEADKPRIAPHVALALLSHDWPLNVRELEQWLRLGWVLAEDGLITKLPAANPSGEPAEESPASARRVLSTSELALREELMLRLERAGGNVAEVARAMGKAPIQVYRWMKRYSLDPDSYRE